MEFRLIQRRSYSNGDEEREWNFSWQPFVGAYKQGEFWYLKFASVVSLIQWCERYDADIENAWLGTPDLVFRDFQSPRPD